MLNRLSWMSLLMMAAVPRAYAEEQAKFDLGVESMRSHSYSVGIFIFMMIAIAVFVGIIIGFVKMDKTSKLKRGEKIMLTMIALGVVVSSIFAAVQLLDGFLF